MRAVRAAWIGTFSVEFLISSQQYYIAVNTIILSRAGLHRDTALSLENIAARIFPIFFKIEKFCHPFIS